MVRAIFKYDQLLQCPLIITMSLAYKQSTSEYDRKCM